MEPKGVIPSCRETAAGRQDPRPAASNATPVYDWCWETLHRRPWMVWGGAWTEDLHRGQQSDKPGLRAWIFLTTTVQMLVTTTQKSLLQRSSGKPENVFHSSQEEELKENLFFMSESSCFTLKLQFLGEEALPGAYTPYSWEQTSDS